MGGLENPLRNPVMSAVSTNYKLNCNIKLFVLYTFTIHIPMGLLHIKPLLKIDSI